MFEVKVNFSGLKNYPWNMLIILGEGFEAKFELPVGKINDFFSFIQSDQKDTTIFLLFMEFMCNETGGYGLKFNNQTFNLKEEWIIFD